jgi:Protein of unknown function (DUF3048) C-terminal domain/Protein of unknown function (DUF3048) N-terminal domain
MTRKLMLLFLVLVLAVPLMPGPSDALAGPPQTPPSTAVNPLTGQSVNDPASLSLPPALVSISNFPVSARPQAGLSYAPIVYELYIGEGMTRYLAIFYGDYPSQATTASGSQPAAKQAAPDAAQATIGPIRSGRVSYEKIRKLYSGFLVMASAYKSVAQSLSQYTNFFGSDGSSVNSALIPVERLEEIAKSTGKQVDTTALSGMAFDEQAPSGKPAQILWLPFSFKNQVFWRYDTESGAYHRFQDNADARTYTEITDRLTGEPLAFENVVVLFAEHERISSTIFDLNLSYIDRAPALLFRDGQVHQIFWTTANGDYEKETGHLRPIRFVDAQGQPFPLKPGQTWIETVTPASAVYESVDAQNWYDLKTKKQPGSGVWVVNFKAP